MDKMKFKTFTWPNNPERYEVEAIRQPVYTKKDDGSYAFQGLSGLCRTMTGSGAFVGEGAYDCFKALQTLLGEKTSGTLVHPVWQSATVYFTRLKLTQEPLENYVAYEFAFQEADGTGAIPKI